MQVKQEIQMLTIMVVMVVHGQAIALSMLAVAAAAIKGQVVLVVAATVIKALTLPEMELMVLPIQVVAVVGLIMLM